MAAPDCRDARARFIELRAAGNTLADIADELGENLATVSDWAKQLDDTVASRKKGKTVEAHENNIWFEGEPHVMLTRGERLHPRIDKSRGESRASHGRISNRGDILCLEMQYQSSLGSMLGILGYFLGALFTRVKSIELGRDDVMKLVTCRGDGEPVYHLYITGPKSWTGKPLTDLIVFKALTEEDRDAVDSMVLAFVPKDKVSDGEGRQRFPDT